MRLISYLRGLLLLLFGIGSLPAARASHILGGDIAYAPVAATTPGVPRYHVTVRLFRDINGVDQPTIRLVYNRGGCNASVGDYFSIDNIPRSQSTRRTWLGCTSSASFRYYDAYVYEADVNLPRGQWTLSVPLENRSAGIINIANSSARSFYITSALS